MVCTTHVFANRGPRAGGDARPYNVVGTVAKHIPPSVYVSSPTIYCEVVNKIHTFSSVLRKGRRGRRPLRVGGIPTCQQPYDAVARGGPRGVEDAAPYGVVFDLFRPPSPPRASIRPRYEKDEKA